jgi:KTSC domain
MNLSEFWESIKQAFGLPAKQKLEEPKEEPKAPTWSIKDWAKEEAQPKAGPKVKWTPDVAYGVEPISGSSNVAGIGYDDKEKTMEVKFKSGASYKYYDVPEDVVKRVKAGQGPTTHKAPPSVGSALDAQVKKAGYEYGRT